MTVIKIFMHKTINISKLHHVVRDHKTRTPVRQSQNWLKHLCTRSSLAIVWKQTIASLVDYWKDDIPTGIVFSSREWRWLSKHRQHWWVKFKGMPNISSSGIYSFSILPYPSRPCWGIGTSHWEWKRGRLFV